MCYHFQNSDMLDWLKSQVRVLEAWREDIATRPRLDLEMVCRLEQHYQWLTKEIMDLESLELARRSQRNRPVLAAFHGGPDVGGRRRLPQRRQAHQSQQHGRPESVESMHRATVHGTTKKGCPFRGSPAWFDSA